MRTTVDINDALLRELRGRAKRTDQSFRKVLETVLQCGLSRESHGSARRKIKIESAPVGINPALRGMSLNQLYDQVEAEEGARKR